MAQKAKERVAIALQVNGTAQSLRQYRALTCLSKSVDYHSLMAVPPSLVEMDLHDGKSLGKRGEGDRHAHSPARHRRSGG